MAIVENVYFLDPSIGRVPSMAARLVSGLWRAGIAVLLLASLLLLVAANLLAPPLLILAGTYYAIGSLMVIGSARER